MALLRIKEIPITEPVKDIRLDTSKYIQYNTVSLIYKESNTLKIIQFNQRSHSTTSKQGELLASEMKLYKKELIEETTFADCFYIESTNGEIYKYDSLVVTDVIHTEVGTEKYYMYKLEAKGGIEALNKHKTIFQKRTH